MLLCIEIGYYAVRHLQVVIAFVINFIFSNIKQAPTESFTKTACSRVPQYLYCRCGDTFKAFLFFRILDFVIHSYKKIIYKFYILLYFVVYVILYSHKLYKELQSIVNWFYHKYFAEVIVTNNKSNPDRSAAQLL